jgi:hypothetical protein
MLRSARAGFTTSWLARSMLFLAVSATLACNVGFGQLHGWPGALLSGWPAVAQDAAVTITAWCFR